MDVDTEGIISQGYTEVGEIEEMEVTKTQTLYVPHTLIVLSPLPLTRVCPSGLIATLETVPVWPVRVWSNLSFLTASGAMKGEMFPAC